MHHDKLGSAARAVSLQCVGTRIVRAHSAVAIAFYLSIKGIVVPLPVAIYSELGSSINALQLKVVTSSPTNSVAVGWIALIAFAVLNLMVNLLVSQGFRLVSAGVGGTITVA